MAFVSTVMESRFAADFAPTSLGLTMPAPDICRLSGRDGHQ
jgi:hypothetical protein